MLPYNRSQAMSKCSRNNSDTIGWASCATFLFWPHFEVIFDLLLNRHWCPTAKSDRSVKIKNQTLVSKNNYGKCLRWNLRHHCPKCDPTYDFTDKGDSTLVTLFHLQTKETGYSMLTEHARAHFDESVLLFHTIIKHVLLNIEGWASKRTKHVNLWIQS